MPDIQAMANAIRFLAIDSILEAGEGHQGVPLGMAEIAATLCANHLKADPSDPLWPDRDRVVLSNGHGSMLLYALLHLSGYEHLGIEALKSFRKLGSVCAGHPEIEQAAGIEITSGMLGQGIACAVGMAVAEARLAAQFPQLADHRTWAFVGDGCLQEGVGQEAVSLAGHLRLGKLTFLWDDNHITDDGDTALSISEDVPARFRAAGWHVAEIDGHDIGAIDAALAAAKVEERPSLIACRTTIARGIPRLQGQRGGHSAPLVPSDRAEAEALLGWTHPAFAVPEEVRAGCVHRRMCRPPPDRPRTPVSRQFRSVFLRAAGGPLRGDSRIAAVQPIAIQEQRLDPAGAGCPRGFRPRELRGQARPVPDQGCAVFDPVSGRHVCSVHAGRIAATVLAAYPGGARRPGRRSPGIRGPCPHGPDRAGQRGPLPDPDPFPWSMPVAGGGGARSPCPCGQSLPTGGAGRPAMHRSRAIRSASARCPASAAATPPSATGCSWNGPAAPGARAGIWRPAA
ncbi:transketolase family protein [Mangrovicoccus ximenensis]|uniref:hypothetical protein n=1 Tax=Mangrovicoccus ximenensis TaxID=1911570 RepID=UPI002ED2803F